jgi:hypothetical protein
MQDPDTSTRRTPGGRLRGDGVPFQNSASIPAKMAQSDASLGVTGKDFSSDYCLTLVQTSF